MKNEAFGGIVTSPELELEPVGLDSHAVFHVNGRAAALQTQRKPSLDMGDSLQWLQSRAEELRVGSGAIQAGSGFELGLEPEPEL